MNEEMSKSNINNEATNNNNGNGDTNNANNNNNNNNGNYEHKNDDNNNNNESVNGSLVLHELPSELLYRISTFLDVQNYLTFGSVCHLFHDVTNANSIWAQFFRDRYCIPRNLKTALEDVDSVSWKNIYTNAHRSYSYWSNTRNLVKGTVRLHVDEDNFGIWSLQYIGNKLVSGYANGAIRVWNLDTRESTMYIEGSRDARGIGMMFSDQFLARGMANGIVELYKWNDDNPYTLSSQPLGKAVISRPTNGFLPSITCLWLDNDRIITSTGTGLQVWDQTVNMVNEVPITDTRWFQPLLYHNESIICGTNRGFLIQKDFRTPESFEKKTRAHNESIWKVECFGSGTGGNLVASAGGDCMVRVWDIRAWGRLYEVAGHHSLVGDVVTDESRILTCANDGKIQVSDIVDGHLLHSIQTADNIRTFVWCIQFDHNKIVSGNTEGVVVIHSVTRYTSADDSDIEESKKSCSVQ